MMGMYARMCFSLAMDKKFLFCICLDPTKSTGSELFYDKILTRETLLLQY